MADFVVAIVGSVVFLGLAGVALWVISTRRQDARIAQLEKRVSVDSFAFAHQARIHHRQIGDLDTRMQYMAREMVTRDAFADTWHSATVDRDRITRP